ncbi:type IV secretion system protein [Helicobacter ailurogastricus]|uniref:type IV secretion system protein n=1 Tax=Helicobacter ailurogastricus TaxID=1578720 RepID=UPI00244D88BF|nr:VirB8/TrbF family protein [Helicobacter ailurogastricus]GMB91228.1 virB8 family protein [Helicobacter ailurogastricus]
MEDKGGPLKEEIIAELWAKIQAEQAKFEKDITSKIESLALQNLDLNSVFRIERRNSALAYKLVVLLSFISLALIVALVMLLPLKKTEHHFIDFANQDKHYAIIQKADGNLASNEALVRSLVGQYILDRESINHIDDQDRYELVRLQSDSQVWQVFESLVASKSSIYTAKKLARDIHIVNIALLKQSKEQNIAQVQIVTKLFEGGKPLSEKRYNIVLSFVFKPLPTFDTAMMPKNPTGFQVTRYSVTEMQNLKTLKP